MGLNDSEFWLSTFAKIKALEDVQEALDRRRDFFPAFLIAIEMNKHRGKDDKLYTAQDILDFQYTSQEKSVNFTPEPELVQGPELGAVCDWQRTKMWLKGR